MRKLIIIPLIFICLSAFAVRHYVAAGGGGAGTLISPFANITQVNAHTFTADDTISFNKGDTFIGTLSITVSGTSGHTIVYNSYGTGVNPIISGFNTLSSWTDETGVIYSKVVTCASRPEMVTIDGVQYGMGRFPNVDTWLTVDSHSGDVSITDADLDSGVEDWTGADVVQRKSTLYHIDRYVITSHVSHTLNYTGAGVCNPTDGMGYFIENDLKTLDAYGEWYYNTGTSTLYMYFGGVDPVIKTVQISTIDDLVTATTGIDYITFDNISFKGANHNALYFDQNDYITVQNCGIDFSGNCGIRGYRTQHLTANNNTINHSNDNGIFINGWYCHYADISENTISNSGLFLGNGSCVGGSGSALILIAGNNSDIEYNNIHNAGFNGISFGCGSTSVNNNFIDSVCLKKGDGSGIYYGGEDVYTNFIITRNIVLNGIGYIGGNPSNIRMTEGIYVDDWSYGDEVSYNTIANCATAGIKIHNSNTITIENNTSYNNGSQMYFQAYNATPSVFDNVVNYNIFFTKGATQYAWYSRSDITNDLATFGTADNNYYARPIDDDYLFQLEQPSFGDFVYKTLAEWQTFSSQDVNSHKSPIAIVDTSLIDFYYNPTIVNSVISLGTPMIDVTGTKYNSSITLMPYTSAILMPDPSPGYPTNKIYRNSGGKVIRWSTGKLIRK
jgi:hypothetical protein